MANSDGTVEPIQVTRCEMPDRAMFDAYMDRLFQNAWLTNRGEFLQELEQRLEEFLNVKHVVLVANGTLALQIAYRLLGLSGEVITTPFSFIATASSLKWEGLTPVFADIDPHTFNLDPEKVCERITARTTAIVPVHVYGNPCDHEAIQRIADDHGLAVIYDAAHAFQVRIPNDNLLEWGEMSVLSFHATKLFHTAEGGALVIKDDELCEQARETLKFGIVGPESIVRLGINAKMSELHAAVGLSCLDNVEHVIKVRAELVARYDAMLRGIVGKQRVRADAKPNHSYYPILLGSETELKAVEAALNREGIMPRRYFYPSLADLHFLSKQEVGVAKDVAARVLCLPLYASLDSTIVDAISDIVVQTVGSR